MSTLIRNGQFLVDDFVALADDAALPAEGRAILSWARWQKEGSAVPPAARQRLGVRIPNTLDLTEAAAQLQGLALVVLEFPAFADGRAYSQARLLRDRFHFAGEIRASGAAVVRDQVFGMTRCGINSFELRSDQEPESCIAALEDFSLAYQPAADTRRIVARRRQTA